MRPARLAALAAVAIVAVAVGGYLAYDTFLRGDAVDPLALPSVAPSASVDAGASATPPPTPAATEGAASASADPRADDGVAGTWAVTSGEAGYRVREQLANLPAETDAVGRTSDVTGSITIVDAADGAQLTDGTITIDTTTIESDESRRDGRMRTEGLETDAFPTAAFTVTTPVDIPAGALAGEATDVTLVGDLTLHGVTRAVEIPAQAQLVDGRISVAGSLPIVLADYDIVAPNVGGFIVSIADTGTLEFVVTFERD